MPRYNVVTVRSLYNAVLIEADDEEAARNFEGEIIDEAETDTWSERHHDIEVVSDDRDYAELP